MLHMAQPGNVTKNQCHWHTAGLAHVSMEVSPFTVILYQKSHTMAAAGSGELLFTGRSASPRTHPSPTSQYLIWIQNASNPVLSATHFHTHYISLFLLCVFTLHSRQRTCRRRCYRCLARFPFSQSRVTSPESVYVCRDEDHLLGCPWCMQWRFLLASTNTKTCQQFLMVWNVELSHHCLL